MSDPKSIQDYVTVYTAYGQLAGEMIRLLLESFNIPAIMSQESAGITYGLTVGPLGQVKIMVPVSHANEAREILIAMDEGKLAGSFYPGQFPSYPLYKENKLKPGEIVKDSGSEYF